MPAVTMQLRSADVVEMRPRGFLGDELFAVFKKAAARAARYDRENKCQTCPIGHYNDLKAAMIAAGFEVRETPQIAALVAAEEREKLARIASAHETLAVVEAIRPPFPYQREGVHFLARLPRALLADQPGLGKTVQALAALPKNAAAIVVCPAVACMVWVDETAFLRPDLRAFRATTKRLPKPGPGQILVLSYEDVMRRLLPSEKCGNPYVECHAGEYDALLASAAQLQVEAHDLQVAIAGEACASGDPVTCDKVPPAPSVESEIATCKMCELQSLCAPHRDALMHRPLPRLETFCSEILLIEDPRVRKRVEMPFADVRIDHNDRGWRLGPCSREEVYVPPCTHLVTDEAHYLKNRRARRSMAHAMLEEKARVAWHLTGTPLPNTADEMWNVLDSIRIATVAFGSREEFAKLMGGVETEVYVGKGKKRVVIEWPDLRAFDGDLVRAMGEEARACLSKVMLRRKKDEVLKDLPQKRFQNITVDVDEAMNADCDGVQKRLLEVYGIDIYKLEDETQIPLNEIEPLRVALARAKTAPAIEIAENYESAGEPLVVFSAHKEPVEAIGKRKGWAYIHGEVTEKKRKAAVRAFQAGELKGIAATIRSAGTALTLTKSHNALFVDLDWVPANNEQAGDRIHRISQLESVLIMFLMSKHPMDMKVSDVLARKLKTIHTILG